MKILYYGNSPWANSGYSRCCNNITRGLKDKGHEVGIQSNYGLLGGIINYGGIKIFPQGSGFSEHETFTNYKEEKYEMLIMQYDIWALDSVPQRVKDGNVIFCPYVPVDHEYVTPRLRAKLDVSFEIVAMCNYGKNLLNKAGYSNVRTIYHGVDTEMYKPLEDYSKEKARTLLGFSEDDFVVGMVAMNRSGRKDIPRQLEAFKIFRDENPDLHAKLYLHTLLAQPDGDNLSAIIDYLEIQEDIRTPNDRQYVLGFSDAEMVKIFQGSDVCMLASPSEGFGMPIIEAQACGTPVIATDSTSMTELLDITPEFRVKTSDTTWAGQIPAKIKIVDRNDIVKKLNLASSKDLSKYQNKLHKHCVKTYDWEKVIIPQWAKFVDDVEERVERDCIRVPEV